MEIRRTFCQICRAECGMLVHLERGRVVKVEGDPEDRWNRGLLCPKGRHAPQILYAEDRLRHPLLRRTRSEDLRRASWEEAIEFIGQRLEEVRDRYGPRALAFYLGTTARVLDTLMVRCSARLYGTPNVTGTWSICVGPKILGYDYTFGPWAMPWCDLRNARYIILWGTNPAVSYLHRHRAVSAEIMIARKRGAKLVVIDPRRTALAARADLHLPIRPGTDLALALSMIHHIIRNGLYDKEFVAQHTHGFPQLEKHLTPYRPSWAEGVTDIEASTIEQVATEFALTKPASLERREGVQHNPNATQTLRALAILLAITGNVDAPGGLTFTPPRPLKGLPLPQDLPPLERAFWEERFPLAKDSSGYLAQAILTGSPYPLQALIVLEGNPLSCFPNTGKVLRALAKLDLLVVQDLFLTETAQLADVVLPGCTFFEKGEISVQSLRRDHPVRTRRPVVEPLYEALPEWKFLCLLGQRLGYGEFFSFRDAEEIIEGIIERSGWRGDEPAQPTPPGFLRERGFNTPTGKVELHSQALQDEGYDPLPKAPLSWRHDPEYPYRLITGARVAHFYHSQHRNIPALRRAHPEPLAEISPALASRIGVAEGEEATIETPLGACPFKVKITEGMHPWTVSIPHGWPGEQNANWLTNDLQCDPLAGTPAYRDLRCRVEKRRFR